MKNEITPHKIALERLKKGDGKVSVDAVHYYYESEVLRQENRVMQFRIIKKAAAGSDTWATSEEELGEDGNMVPEQVAIRCE